MDQELREYLEKRFHESSEQLQQFRQETTERLEGVEAAVRHTNVLVEGLQGQIQLVAEGVATVDAKLERFRGEVAAEFKEVRSTMDLHYSHLDRRVKKLEDTPQPPKRAPSSRAS